MDKRLKTREQPWGRDDRFIQAAASHKLTCKGSRPDLVLNPISIRRCPTTAAKWRTRARPLPQKTLTRTERESGGVKEIAPDYAPEYRISVWHKKPNAPWQLARTTWRPRCLLHTIKKENHKKKLRGSGFFYNFIVIFFLLKVKDGKRHPKIAAARKCGSREKNLKPRTREPKKKVKRSCRFCGRGADCLWRRLRFFLCGCLSRKSFALSLLPSLTERNGIGHGIHLIKTRSVTYIFKI